MRAEDGTGVTEPRIAGEARDRDEHRRAVNAALNLLALRPRSVAEVVRVLARRGYPEGQVASVIEGLTRAGYLNDERFAVNWVEERERHRPCGPARLRRELELRGVSGEIVERVLSRRFSDEVEEKLAVAVAQRRVAFMEGDDEAGIRRLWAFLRRRGFGGRACRAAVEAVTGGRMENDA